MSCGVALRDIFASSPSPGPHNGDFFPDLKAAKPFIVLVSYSRDGPFLVETVKKKKKNS